MTEKNECNPEGFADGAFYRKVIDQARDIILVVNPNGDILDANQAAVDAYGYSAAELCLLRIHDLRAPETRDIVESQMNRALQEGILFRTFHLRRSGERFSVEVSSRQVRFSDQEAIVSVIRDITAAVAVETALQESEEKFRLLVENIHTGVFIFDKQRFIYVNPPMYIITGYSEAELLAMNFWDIIHAGQRDLVRDRGLRRLEGIDEPSSYLMRVNRKDGETRWCEVTAMRQQWAGKAMVIGLLYDVTDRSKAEEMLAASEMRYRMLAENVGDVIWTINFERQFTYVSPSVTQQLGYAPQELLYCNILDIVHPEFHAVALENFKRMAADKPSSERGGVFELQLVRRDGSRLWAEISANLLRDDGGRLIGLLGVSRDIATRKQLQEELVRLATIDGMTGAINRNYFMELAGQEMERSLRHRHQLSLLFVDIDHFKEINDTYGHRAGDEMLNWFAGLVRETVRDYDILGRMGGDEFAVLLPETATDAALQIAERLRQTVENSRLAIDAGQAIAVTVSIGITSREDSDKTFEELLKKADVALYRAKNLQRNCVQVETLHYAADKALKQLKTTREA